MKHIFEYLFSKKSDLDKIKINSECYIIWPNYEALEDLDAYFHKYLILFGKIPVHLWVIPVLEYDQIYKSCKTRIKRQKSDLDIWKSDIGLDNTISRLEQIFNNTSYGDRISLLNHNFSKIKL